MGHWYLLLLSVCINLTCNSAVKDETSHATIEKFSFKKRPVATPANKDKKTAVIKKYTQSNSPKEKAKTDDAQPPEGTIYFNFDNASLTTVLNYLVDRKNMDVIPHKDLVNIKVSLVSREPMTIDEAWETMLILMEANNFTIVTVNGIHRVVPLTTSPQSPLPCYSSLRGIEPEDLPDTNTISRYIYFCKNLKIDIARDIITPLLSDKAVQVNATLQACIITDNCNYIKAALRVIKELDVNGMRQNIKILQLNHTNADQLAKLLNEQLIQNQQQDNSKIRIIGEEKKREMSYFSKDTKIFSEPMHNRLIFMGMEDAINKIIAFINKYLDIPLESAKSRLHIKELKYYSASAMKDLLEPMIVPPKGLGGPTGLVEGEYKFFQDVTITPEISSSTNGSPGSGNRLIIACNPEDWQRLSAFINEVDKPVAQVAIEMMIVDVQVNDNVGLGSQFRVPTGMLGDNISASSYMLGLPSQLQNSANPGLSNVLNNTAFEPIGSSILSFGNASSNQVWGAIRAWYKLNHSDIISQPYIVTNNNETGIIASSVTHQIPTVQTNNSTQPVQILQPQTASIQAKITPHVNASGIIKLEVDITVDEFVSATNSGSDKTNREISVKGASMAAGEVLVLGGLTSSEHDNSTWTVPILGSIPILGNLFRDKTRTNIKKNLYIFIRPTVIKPHFGLGADEYTQLKLDYAKYQVLTGDSATATKDPIQRYLFSPNNHIHNKESASPKDGHMAIIDDFAERRHMPNEVEMAKDQSFYQIHETNSMAYEPDEGFASMPHVKPQEYVTPGVFDNLMQDDFFSTPEPTLSRATQLSQRQSSLRTQ